MTGAAALLRERIEREGPVSFRDFMETALYDPRFGYYRGAPFGMQGDFYTAEQIQPVFGRLIARRIRMLFEEMGAPAGFRVVELGAGRGEMAHALAEFDYVPVDLAPASPPDRFQGVVFCNEFLDALPIHAAVMRGGRPIELRVGIEGDRFVWREGSPVSPEIQDYIGRYLLPREEGAIFEIPLDALAWLDRIARALESGFVLMIDYGYTTAESIRFPRGTLMSYRRHRAIENVLNDPGMQDITSHVCFTALEDRGRRLGLRTIQFETLASALLRAGEQDQFAGALAADSPAEQHRLRMQLKQLLFGMGETFRVLLQRK